MIEKYEFEIGKAADALVRDFFELKKGETFIITADTESDEAVVNATARAAFSVGAKPMVIWLPAALGVGKAADPMLPVDALTGALMHADAWVEFNNKWLLYSTPFERAMAENKKLRYICLVGMDADMMVRTIGRVDTSSLSVFMNRVAEMTGNAKTMRLTTPAGTDVSFSTEPKNTLACDDGNAREPGIWMLSGQINVIPAWDTINGTIVFDGSLDPPCGLLDEPVSLTVEKGRVVKIEGGKQADSFESWLKSHGDENMFRMAHMAYGFNPGANLTGNILEDERVWGATEWGLGYVSALEAPPAGIDAVSHTDGICLNSSVWLDDKQIMDKGKIVDEELKVLEASISE